MAKKRKPAAGRRSNVARRGATSASQYGAAQAVLSGLSKLMPRKVAAELVERTPAKKRQAFARQLAKRRKNPAYIVTAHPTLATGALSGLFGARVSRGMGAKSAAVARKKAQRLADRTGKRIYVFAGSSGRELFDVRPKNPGVRKCSRRKNQEDTSLAAARHMFKKFTGKKSTRVEVVEQLRVTPDALADCGRLVELVVDTGHGGRRIPSKGATWHNAPRVATTGDGGQLYFLKGDQTPDLSAFPGIRLPKDHLDLGELVSIVYFTSKDFHNFDPSEYEHTFGVDDETGAPRGRRPTLHYDVHSKRLYLTGGTYRVKRAGIVG